jgi:predicted PurR-regulated permease PerM
MARRPGIANLVLRWVVLAFAVGAFLTFWPLWAPLVIAAWLAHILGPVQARVAHWMRKSERGAAALTVVMVLVTLAPIIVIGLSLAAELVSLYESFTASDDVRQALNGLIHGERSPRAPAAIDVMTVTEIARRHGASAFGMARQVAGATTIAIIGMSVFVYGFYAFLAHGRSIYRWIVRHAPMAERDVSRLADAFNETGRGLLVGYGLTALAQGVAATLGYLLIGLPHALLLGLLTAIASLLPAVGTGLVWVPLAIGLVLSGEVGKAIGVLVLGLVISIGDNFLRPVPGAAAGPPVRRGARALARLPASGAGGNRRTGAPSFAVAAGGALVY